jgi:hypothetical protein
MRAREDADAGHGRGERVGHAQARQGEADQCERKHRGERRGDHSREGDQAAVDQDAGLAETGKERAPG